MAKNVQQFDLDGLSFEDYMAYAVQACNQLGWTVTYVSESGLQAETPASLKKNSWGEEITITRNETGVTIKSESKGSVLIDFGRNKKNILLFNGQLTSLRNGIEIHQLEPLKAQILENRVRGDEDLLNPSSVAAKESAKWWKVLIPSKEFLITPLIIDINILLFLAMVITSGKAATIMVPDNDTLLTWGANFKPLVLQGEWWRLFASTFEHIGIIHLAMNMYALLYAGLYLEPLLGKLRFITAYVVTGLFASLASLWWHDNSIGAGASGAIFGMYGVFFALLLTNLIEKSVRQQLLKSISIFIGYNILIGLSAGFVDNAAHLGGLLSGILVGFVLYLSLIKRADTTRMVALCVLLAASVFTTAYLLIPRIKNPVGDYISIMEKVSRFEENAIAVYNLPDSTSATVLLKQFQEKTGPAWDSCETYINKAKKLDLPDPLQKKLVLLTKYVQARKKEVALREKALTENSAVYNTEINEVVKEIEGLLKKLNEE